MTTTENSTNHHSHRRLRPSLVLIGVGLIGTLLLRWTSSIQMLSTYSDIYKRSTLNNTTLNDSPAPPSFTELLIESGSDKYHRHHYEKYYRNWLADFRNKPALKFLEIGARDGKSLGLWSKYFTQPSLILGLAYDAHNKSHTTRGVEDRSSKLENVQVYFGDQSKKETMNALKEKGPWDIIIDDGSHVPQHMVFSLFSLWESVTPGGLYVIEDLETNYWPSGDKIYGYTIQGVGIGAPPEHSAIPKLQQLQQVLVRHQIGANELSIMPGDSTICSIEWGMNIVAIRKCSEVDVPPPYQKKRYNETNMQQWMTEAKRTNPVV